MLPPHAMTFRTSTPEEHSTRTALRTSSTESAVLPHQCRWPPVVVSGAPALSTRGPGSVPAAIASLSASTTKRVSPRSRTVVTPPSNDSTALRAPVRASSAADDVSKAVRVTSWSTSHVNSRCTWASMKPGAIVCALRSLALALDSSSSSAHGVMNSIRLPRSPMAVSVSGSPPSPVSTVPPRSQRSPSVVVIVIVVGSLPCPISSGS